MRTNIQAINLNLTDELRKLVEKKMKDSLRVFGNIQPEQIQATIRLAGINSRHQNGERMYRVDAVILVPGASFRIEEEAREIERAIVELKRTLMRDVKRWREKLRDTRRKRSDGIAWSDRPG